MRYLAGMQDCNCPALWARSISRCTNLEIAVNQAMTSLQIITGLARCSGRRGALLKLKYDVAGPWRSLLGATHRLIVWVLNIVTALRQHSGSTSRNRIYFVFKPQSESLSRIINKERTSFKFIASALRAATPIRQFPNLSQPPSQPPKSKCTYFLALQHNFVPAHFHTIFHARIFTFQRALHSLTFYIATSTFQSHEALPRAAPAPSN